jgi:hypothetical protein
LTIPLARVVGSPLYVDHKKFLGSRATRAAQVLSAARMRSVFVFLGSSGLALSLATAAQAQSAPESFLSVTREDGAESCPDTDALSQHVERVRGREATGEPSAYRVSFTRRGGVFRAEIRVGAGSGVRVLRDRGATCASLEQATALTLALLLDSDSHELPTEKTEPDEPPPAPPPTKPLEQAPPEPDRRRPATTMSLAFGGGGLFGVVQPVGPTALGELGIGVNRFHTSVGVLWMPEQTLDFGPGRLDETLLSAVARTCVAAARSQELRFDLCSGIYAGLLKVRADGYTRNDSANKPWLAVPLELALSTTSQPVGVEVSVSALLPLRRNDFAIDNLGVAYVSWPVGMLLSMRAVANWGL